MALYKHRGVGVVGKSGQAFSVHLKVERRRRGALKVDWKMGGWSQDSRENKNTISPLNLMMIFAFHVKKPVFSKFWLKKKWGRGLSFDP
jgi:hypothetical protein